MHSGNMYSGGFGGLSVDFGVLCSGDIGIEGASLFLLLPSVMPGASTYAACW